MTLLGGLLIVSMGLTCTMFATRQAMLGFACAIFWFLAGGQSYTLSTATWDIYYTLAIASILGMGTMSMLGAYGLREKRDTLADESMDEEVGEDEPYIDEKPNKPPISLSRAGRIRQRAEERRKRYGGR